MYFRCFFCFTFPAHTGQPVNLPLARVNTTVRHTWPSLQRHQTFFWLPVVTISGVSEPLRSCAHSAATFGCCDARSLNPGSTRRPVQYGQPLPLVLRAEISD